MQFNPAAFLEGKLQTEDKALIAEAIRLMNWCHYKRGDLIVKEGNPVADYRFLASEGVVRCIYHTAAGKEITECIVSKPGSCLMPSAVLSAPSPVDMEALTDVDIVSFPIQAVAELELKYPQILRMENQVLTECWQEQWELKRTRRESPPPMQGRCRKTEEYLSVQPPRHSDCIRKYRGTDRSAPVPAAPQPTPFHGF